MFSRWGLGSEDLATLSTWSQDTGRVVEIDKDTFSRHLDPSIGEDIFQVGHFEYHPLLI